VKRRAGRSDLRALGGCAKCRSASSITRDGRVRSVKIATRPDDVARVERVLLSETPRAQPSRRQR